MTMLYSLYTAEGIVYAADSRITVPGKPAPLPPQRKVLPVPQLGFAGGVVGFFGLAQVSGAPMSDWLQAMIAAWPGSNDINAFGRHLADRLAADLTARERKHVSGFHVGTFERRAGRVVPMFLFVRNARRYSARGYSDVRLPYIISDDFMGRDVSSVPVESLRQALRETQRLRGMAAWYRNGDVPYFGTIASYVEAAIASIIQQPRTRFKPPKTLDAWTRLARALVTTVGQLYRVYYAAGDAPPVGGKVFTESILWPS